MPTEVTIAGQTFVARGYKLDEDVLGRSLETIIEGMSPVIVPDAEMIFTHPAGPGTFIIKEVGVRKDSSGNRMTTVTGREMPMIQGPSVEFPTVDEWGDIQKLFGEMKSGKTMSASIDQVNLDALESLVGRKVTVDNKGNPVLSTLPPCGSYHVLATLPREGDQIVITDGEQFGWRGRIAPGFKTKRMPASVPCIMTRPDGTKANNNMPIVQRIEYVRKVLGPVPQFTNKTEADNWLTVADPEIRPAYANGQTIRFRWAHRAKRESPDLDGVLMKVVEDVELTGKVLAFKDGKSGSRLRASGFGALDPDLAYKVLTFEKPGSEGDPKIIWVEPGRIIGPAGITTP